MVGVLCSVASAQQLNGKNGAPQIPLARPAGGGDSYLRYVFVVDGPVVDKRERFVRTRGACGGVVGSRLWKKALQRNLRSTNMRTDHPRHSNNGKLWLVLGAFAAAMRKNVLS